MDNINELSISNPKIVEVLNNTPTVTKKEFYELLQPCDIFLTYTPKVKLTGRKLRLKQYITAKAQRGPFTTSKMVYSETKVFGYGIKLIQPADVITFEYENKRRYINSLQKGCICRPLLTDPQKQKVLKFLEARIGLPYDTKILYKNIWNRILNRKFFPFFKRELTKEELREYGEPLICSSIFAIAIKASGSKLEFSKNVFDVWPHDFLLSPHTKKIGKFGV